MPSFAFMRQLAGLKRLDMTIVLFACAGMASVSAMASAPAEQVPCTHMPKSHWVGESRIREVFDSKDYVSIAFKESRTRCYEFYAIHKDGSVVEAYYHPVTAELLKFSRVSPGEHTIAYTSSLRPQPVAPGLAARVLAVGH